MRWFHQQPSWLTSEHQITSWVEILAKFAVNQHNLTNHTQLWSSYTTTFLAYTSRNKTFKREISSVITHCWWVMHSNDLTPLGKQLLSVLVTHWRNWICAMKNWQKSSKLQLNNLKVDKELTHKYFIKKMLTEITKYKKKVEQAGKSSAPHWPPSNDLNYIRDDLSTNQIKYIKLTLCMLQHTKFPWMEKNAFSWPSTFVNQTAVLHQSQVDHRLLLTTTQAWNMCVTLDTLLTEHHSIEGWSWWDSFSTQLTTMAEKGQIWKKGCWGSQMKHWEIMHFMLA